MHIGSGFAFGGNTVDRPYRLSIDLPASGEPSKDVSLRVQEARSAQNARYHNKPYIRTNADASGEDLSEAATITETAKELLKTVAERFRLSARAYYRVMRVARTIADLDGADTIAKHYIAESVSFRLLNTSET